MLALLPLDRRVPKPAPVTVRSEFAAAAPDLVSPPPRPLPDFELPERVEALPEELPDEWHLDAPELLFDPEPRFAPVPIATPDPMAAEVRVGPRRLRPPAPEPPAPAEEPVVHVSRPAAEPPPPAPTLAAIVKFVEPRYPRAARDLGIEGVVVLQVVVAADGSLESVDVAKSSGSALLDRAAIAAVESWKFRPATVRGEPVRSTLRLPPVKFRLTD